MKRIQSFIDFAMVAAPKVASGAFLIVLNIWLLRRLSPESYGTYTLCLAMIALLSEGLFGAALDMAAMRQSSLWYQENPERAIGVERAAVRLKIQVIGLLSGILFVFASPLGQALFHRNGTEPLFFLVSAAALGGLLLASALLHLQVRGRFWQYGSLDSLNGLIKFGGITLVLALHRPVSGEIDPSQLLLWFAVGPAVASLVFCLTIDSGLWASPKSVVSENSPQVNASEVKDSGLSQKIYDAANRLWRSSHPEYRGLLLDQAKWIFATLLISALVAKLDILLLAWMGSTQELGVYAGGQTISSIPILIGSYMGIVLNPKVMPACRNGNFFSLLRNVQLPLFAGCLVTYIIVFIFREHIRDDILPERFRASADIILILLPCTLASMTSYPLAITFLMFVSPRLLIYLECSMLVPLVLAYAVAIPCFGSWGAAVVTSVAGLIKTCVAQVAAFNLAQKSRIVPGLAVASGPPHSLTAKLVE
jgi:hypothetical protein